MDKLTSFLTSWVFKDENEIRQFQNVNELPVQTFEKRIKINGESANYRLIIDKANGEVVTFFKIGQ
jgi:hypothetical protein